jgi:hypothetical protein
MEHPVIQTLFPNNDAVFQDDIAPIHKAESVHSWFVEHEDELQHLTWKAQTLHLDTTEPLWSVLETRMRNRFPLPTSLEQVEHVLQKETFKDYGRIKGKILSNIILINKSVQYA